MINVAVLGCTGSIGRQTLNVIRRNPDKFRVSALVCGSDADILLSQAEEFKPDFVGIADETKRMRLDELKYRCEKFAGAKAQEYAAALPCVDTVVAAVVGLNGLKGVIAAINAGKRVALANKETLVAAGRYVTDLAKSKNVDILPVDSEHCAVFQCLKSGKKSELKRIILTASGGPFFGAKNLDELKEITPEQAVRHPNWAMGKKISVDSATMMNKGLELIEARWLFDTMDVDYIIQPESVIHSMVEFVDGSVIAQLAPPDMEMPIAYALNYPDRFEAGCPKFDFTKNIRFFEPNEEVFPLPKLAKSALKEGGTAPAILNAANEAAVRLFLEHKIGFTDIMRIVEHTLNSEKAGEYGDYLEIIELHNRIYGGILKQNGISES